MKVYISADIEGVTGATHWDDTDQGLLDYTFIYNGAEEHPLNRQVNPVGEIVVPSIRWEALRLGWQEYRRAQDGFSRAYAAGVLAAFVAVLVAGMMDDYFMPYVYNIGFPGFRSAIWIWR